jgi:alpha-1,6-mannosyltransferase
MNTGKARGLATASPGQGETVARQARVVLAAFGVGCLLVAAGASLNDSPMSSVAPGTSRFGPFPRALEAIHVASLPSVARLVLCFGAMGLVAAGFLLVLRESWQRKLSTTDVVVAILVLHLVAVAMPLFGMQDIYQYAMYGRIVSVHHLNPYLVTPNDVRADPVFHLLDRTWRGVPAFYGPVLVSLFAAVTRLVRSLPGIVLTFKLLAAMSSLGTAFLLYRLAQRLRPDRDQFALVLFGLNPLVIFTGVASGHTDCLIALALASALLLLAKAEAQSGARIGYELTATAILAVAALMKATVVFPLLLAVPIAVLRRSAKDRIRVVAAHIAVVAIVCVIFATPYFQWHDPTLGMTRLSRWASYLAPATFGRVLVTTFADRLGAGPVARRGMSMLIAGAFLAVFAASFAMILSRIRRLRRALKGPSIGASWGWTLLIFTLAAPILFPWYMLWVLPFAWLLPMRQRMGVIGLCLLTFLIQAVTNEQAYPALSDAFIVIGLAVVAPLGFLVLLQSLGDLTRGAIVGRKLEEEVS